MELAAFSDTELLANQVEASGDLGDGVLHLQTGVDLKEGDQAVGTNQVLNGARTVVAGFLTDSLSGLVQTGALLIRQEGSRSLLNKLLETTLQGAVTSTSNHNVAVHVSNNLALNVASLVQVALDEALAATEGCNSLAGSGLVEVLDLIHFVRDLHAAAAATKRGLNGDRQSVLFRECTNLSGVFHGLLGTRSHRSVSTHSNVAGSDLVAQFADGLRGGADPDQTSVDHGLSKVAILGQEAVAGVDSVSAGLLRGVKNLVEDKVGFGRILAAEGERLIRHGDERCVGIGLCVHGDTGDTSVTGCADHADGDLTAVGHKDLSNFLGLDRH